MSTELENPVIQADSAEEAELLRMSQEVDQSSTNLVADNDSESQLTPIEEARPTPVGDLPDAAETEKAAAEGRARDEQGRFVKTPEEEKAAAEAAPPEETPYTKAQKEQMRREKTWVQINERKDALERREWELQQRETQLQQQRQQPAPASKLPFTSQQLAEASNDFEARAIKALKEGDYDVHGENLELARQARDQAGKIQQLEFQEQRQTEAGQFRQTWEGVMIQSIQQDPELRKADTPLSKEVQVLLANEPLFGYLPDGFAKAKELAQLRLDARSTSELRETNKKLQGELDRLNGLTSIRGSGPTTPGQVRDFDSMPLDDQLAALERASQNVDFGR